MFAEKFSKVNNYWEVVTSALKEMHDQVGDLKISKRGIAQRGMLIRHLVLPHNIAGSERVLEFIANKLSRNSYVNIMDQYHPDYKAAKYPELNRTITSDEYSRAVLYAKKLGLTRGLCF
jgi:putative pyruvate formate lyase activating enzyme